MDADDLKLVRDAQGGERAAFAALVDRYRGRVYALAVSIMKDHASALELTKETFLRAHKALPGLAAPERFPAWLARLAYEAGREARHRRLEDSEQELQEDEKRPVRGVDDRPEGTIATPFGQGEAERALLEALLAAMPERMRVALDLRYREELSYAEIAETLDVPREKVREIVERATRHLHGRLRPQLARAAKKAAGGESP